MQIYIVKSGDTVDSIAASFGVSVETLIYDNQLIYPYSLTIGLALLLNTGSNQEEQSTVIANGYAYPYISPWVFRQTLPFLSRVSIFSYGFTTQGELIPPGLDDSWMIADALEYGVVPFLTLTPFGPDGQFNNYLIHAIVTDLEARSRLIDELAATMQEKGYGGLDIDFEYILREDRDAFTEFVRAVKERMQSLGYPLSVALAPKTSADQEGLLYEGKDYGALGAIADSVLLMTYEWGYKYGPNMAVAPLHMVRRVVEYALTEIPANKIMLGIPNYGYDWPLPFERNVTAARTVGNVEAVQIAISYGVPIEFDELSQSPFFRYQQNGTQHEVWFEDVRSIQQKFSLVQEYDLLGMGYWQLMRWWRANWLLLEDTFVIA